MVMEIKCSGAYIRSMAGLAGIIYPELFTVGQAITPMLQIMRHRGRHPQDTYGFHQLQLGCCGSELYFTDKGNLCACIDGEIHNKKELQEQLKREGYAVRDGSDAEIIVFAYDHWGELFVQKILGYFAIVLFDQDRELLYLYRDRLGKTPLYWSQPSQHFLFASELKALIATGLLPQVADRQALGTYSLLGYIPQDVTAIQGINRLLPGHFLRASLNGACSVHPYWVPESCFQEPEQDWSKQFQFQVEQSLSRIDTDNADLGCVVGEGPASELLARELLNKVGGQLKRYQVSYGTENEPGSINLRARDLMSDLVNIVWHMEDPIADLHSIASWKLCQTAKADGISHLFNSSGFDELFRPLSPRRYAARRLRWLPLALKLPTNLLSDILIPLLEWLHPPSASRLLRHRYTDAETVERLRDQRLLSEKLLRHLLPKLQHYVDWDFVAQKFFREGLEADPSYRPYFDQLRSSLPDNHLQHWRQSALVHKVQWPTPCLTQAMLQRINAAPILEEAQGNQSHPFDYPWVREPEFRRALRMCGRGSLEGQGLLNGRSLIQHIKKAHNQAPLSYPLWGILILEIWNRLFVHSPMPLEPPNVSVEEFLSSNF